MSKTLTVGVSQKAHGRVKIMVTECGRVVRELPWQNNLILNQGLNNVCSTYVWADAFLYCAAGSGTTATNVPSGGGNTGSGVVTTFTGPGAIDFTVVAAVGDMLKMTSGASSGSEVRITSVTDATHVEYTPSGTLNSGEFTVFKTSQTGLTTELKRTNNYLTGAGNCESGVSGSVLTMQRTYDFTTEVGAVTYNEIGLSQSASVASNLFSRIKLSSGVALVAGQALRVVYALAITLSPTTPQARTFPVAGWPVLPSTSVDGDEQIIRPSMSGVTTTGSTTSTSVGWDGNTSSGGTALNFTTISNIRMFLSPSTAAIDSFAGSGTPTTRATNATVGGSNPTLNSYTALDFYREKSYTFTVGEGNRTDFRVIGLGSLSSAGGGGTGSTASGQSFLCLFDEPQTKDSLHTLTITFRLTAGRVLA